MAYKILIVDDSYVTRAVLEKTISMVDVPVEEVTHASDGSEALEVLREEPVDLVFADLNMPVMNGVDMIAHMRADERISSVPVVVISTESSSTKIDQLIAQGVKNYVHKPFTPEQIRQVLIDTLELCMA